MILNREGNKLGEITDYFDIAYSYEYNNYGYFKIKIPLSTIKNYDEILQTNSNYIQYYVGDETSPRFDGIIINKRIVLNESQDNYVLISAFSLLYLLEVLDVDINVEDERVDVIITNLYNQKAAEAPLPFALGNLEVTQRHSIEANNSTFLEVLKQLEVYGYGFEIKDRDLNFYNQLGEWRKDIEGKPTVILQYGDGGIIKSVDYEIDGTTFRNKNIALGAGSGITQIKSTSTNIASRNLIGLFAKYSYYPSFTDPEILDILSQRDLEKNLKASTKLNIEIDEDKFTYGSFNVGDIIYIQIKDENLTTGEWVRVYKMEFIEDDLGIEKVNLDIKVYT